ncbi:MAG: aminoacyl-tRNA hydrolase, partial [Chloroflexi bacterium RBG_13_56_8]
GLGNPGADHADNRHNVGFQAIDHLSEVYGLASPRKQNNAFVGEIQIGSHHVLVAKPLTFMNQSGGALRSLSQRYEILPERILVIHDDLDLPLGKIRLRATGSSGGHKGIESIISKLGTRDFARLRIGIGRPNGGDPTDYVLADFTKQQLPIIQESYQLAERAVVCFLEEGIEEAMNKYNNFSPSDTAGRCEP